MKKLFFVSTTLFFFLTRVAYGQGYKSINHLITMSDEILVVKILSEKAVSESFMTCKSYVVVEISEKLKTTRLDNKTLNLQFVRIVKCDSGSVYPKSEILKKENQYVIFLTSGVKGHDNVSNVDVYPLSDYFLGLQLYREDIVAYLRDKKNR